MSAEIDKLVEKCCAENPEAFGDGAILKWLIANAPQIIALVQMMIALFKGVPLPTPAPTPAPSPVPGPTA